MPITNVKSRWYQGDLYFDDASKNEILRLDGANRKLYLPSGSTLELAGSLTLPAGSIEAADLGTNLQRGFIPLNLFHAYLISSNNTINTTEGAYPDGNTTPIMARINAATDKTMRLVWAANDVSEVQFPPIALPPDLDDTAAMTVHLYGYKDANANATFAIDVQVFFNVGDTECGAATAAITETAATEKSVSIAASDVPAHPGVMTISLAPGAHNSDAYYLLGAWVEYQRKS